jgi:hypothetical protein
MSRSSASLILGRVLLFCSGQTFDLSADGAANTSVGQRLLGPSKLVLHKSVLRLDDAVLETASDPERYVRTLRIQKIYAASELRRKRPRLIQ